MKFGVFGINFGPCAEPAAATHVLVLAVGASDDASHAWPSDTLAVVPQGIGER